MRVVNLAVLSLLALAACGDRADDRETGRMAGEGQILWLPPSRRSTRRSSPKTPRWTWIPPIKKGISRLTATPSSAELDRLCSLAPRLLRGAFFREFRDCFGGLPSELAERLSHRAGLSPNKKVTAEPERYPLTPPSHCVHPLYNSPTGSIGCDAHHLQCFICSSR